MLHVAMSSMIVFGTNLVHVWRCNVFDDCSRIQPRACQALKCHRELLSNPTPCMCGVEMSSRIALEPKLRACLLLKCRPVSTLVFVVKHFLLNELPVEHTSNPE